MSETMTNRLIPRQDLFNRKSNSRLLMGYDDYVISPDNNVHCLLKMMEEKMDYSGVSKVVRVEISEDIIYEVVENETCTFWR